MKIKREFVMREVAGEYILVPVNNTALEMNGIAVVNGVGARLWELLPEAEDAESLAASILEEYDADEATVRADVEEFLKKIGQYGII